MIWTCSLGIHKQFGGGTCTAIRWITKEIANNDMVQLTKFVSQTYIHLQNLYFNKVHPVL